MKKIIKQIFFLSMLAAMFASCKKDEHKIFFDGGTNPVLTASVSSANLPLSFDTKDNVALVLSWTNPNYKFTTGVSSQDVSYQVEIDTAGSNFTSSKRQIISVNKDLSLTLVQSVLNDYLLNQLQLVPEMEHQLEIRVTSFLKNSSEPLASNVLKYAVTPYAIPAKVAPPTDGTLWLTGDATTSGYANPLPSPYDVSQKFTQLSNTLYELTVTMKGGGAYKLIQTQGNWNTQYHMITGGSWNGGDFEMKNSDPGFPGPVAAGSYKITVDFQRGKYSAVKL